MACKNRFYALFEWHSIEKSFKFYHSPCLHAALQFFMNMSPERLVTCTEMFSSSVACRPGVLQRLECIMSSYTELLSSQPSKTVKFCSLKLVKSRAFLKSDVFELTSRLLKPRNLSYFMLQDSLNPVSKLQSCIQNFPKISFKSLKVNWMTIFLLS